MIKILQVFHSLHVAGTEVLIVRLIKELRSYYEMAVCCLDEKGELGKQLEKENITVFNLSRRPGLDLKTIQKMRQILTSYAPRIIHAHQYTPFFYSAIAKKRANVLLFTEHGRHYPDVVSFKRRCFNQILEMRADWMGAVCEFSKKRLIERERFHRKKIEVIYNGVLLDGINYEDSEDTKRELGIPLDRKVIGFLGRLHPIKNPILLLEAFALLVKERPEFHLLYLGDGELLAQLKSRVRSLGLDGKVTFAGMRFPVYPYLKVMDLFVLPSLSEGLSVTLLESMVANVPVLVTDVGGNSECVIDGENGQLVPSGDKDALFKGMLKVLSEPRALSQMAENAYTRVTKNFSLERMIKQYHKLYDQFI